MKFFLTFLVAIVALCVIEVKFALTKHSTGAKTVRKYKELGKIHRKHKGPERKQCGKSFAEKHNRKSSSSESDESNEKHCKNIVPLTSLCKSDASCTRCLTPSFKFVSSCWHSDCFCSLSNYKCDKEWVCCDGSACQANGTCPPAAIGGLCMMYPPYPNLGNCATGTCQSDSRTTAAFKQFASDFGICAA